MKKIFLFIISLLLLTVILNGTVTAESTRVVVMDFETDGIEQLNENETETLLADITTMFKDRLTETTGYNILEQEQIFDNKTGKSFSRGKRPPHSIANQLQNTFNLDLLILGQIDQLKVEKSGIIEMGPITFGELEIITKLKAEIIDLNQPQATETYTSTGSAKKVELGLDLSDEQVSELKPTSFPEELDEALEQAVDELVNNIASGETIDEEINDKPETRTLEAEIISIVGDNLVINKGKQDGLELEQKGNIVQYENDNQLSVIGEAKVIEVDRESAIMKPLSLNQEPTTGNLINIPIKIDSAEDTKPVGEPIKVKELDNFIIEIHEAVKSNGRATIKGTAQAKNTAELEIILSNRDFHDHQGQRHSMSGRQVSIGPWTNSSGDSASLTESFNRGETKEISWSFTEIPEDVHKLSRIILWLRTPEEGSISMTLRDLEF